MVRDTSRYVIETELFRPISSSMWVELMSLITGNPAEYFDTKFIAQNKDREGSSLFSSHAPRPPHLFSPSPPRFTLALWAGEGWLVE